MRNVVVGSNQLTNVIPMRRGEEKFERAVITRDPVETISSAPSTSCMTGDIIWSVAKDVMSGWLCDTGVWKVFGK